MTKLKALLLSDGKPGHYHLAEGMLAAVERVRPVTVNTVQVRRPRWLTPGLLWRLSTSGLSPALVLGYAYGLDAGALPRVDLVVSAGGDTLAANVAAARLLKAPNIFYGSLRRYAPEDFSLVLTSYARNAAKPRHVMSLKPCSLDPDTLPPISRAAGKAPRLAGLLVGGDAGTVHFKEGDWKKLLDALAAIHNAHGMRWIISNSPRTPDAVSTSIAKMADGPNGPIAEFIDVRSAGTGTLARLFGSVECVLCTANSSSMLSEAVWARRPVLSVAPVESVLPAAEQEYRTYLEDNGWARAMPIADLTPQSFLDALGHVKPLAANPLDALAEMLKEKLLL